MPLGTQKVKRPQPCAKKTTTLGYHRLVRETTRGITYEGHPLDAQIQQLNIHLNTQRQTSDLDSLSEWTTDWVEQRLNWLGRFGKLFIKHAESNPLHIRVDHLIPMTHIWDGYLHHSNPEVHLNPEQCPFVWDVYVLIRRPIKCVLHPGWLAGMEPGMAKFTIEIPPPLKIESDVQETNSDDDASPNDQSFDPYEWIRQTRTITKIGWSKKFGKQYTITEEQHLIDPVRTVDAIVNHLIPITFDSIMSKPEDFGIRLLSWRPCDTNGRTTTDTFELQLQARIVNESRQPTRAQSRVIQRKRPENSRLEQSTAASVHSSTWKLSSGRGSAAYHHYGQQPTSLVRLFVRFVPVYSMNDLQAKNPFLLKNVRSTENSRILFQNHTFLRPMRLCTMTNSNGYWQACTPLTDQVQLSLLDYTDKGQRRAAMRLILYLFHVSDCRRRTKILNWIEPDYLIQIALHATSREVDLSNLGVLAYLSSHGGKPIAWQRAPLTLILLQLLKFIYDTFQNLRLPTFNGIITNLFRPPMTDEERKELSKTRTAVGAWIKSEAALRQVLESAIKQIKEKNCVTSPDF